MAEEIIKTNELEKKRSDEELLSKLRAFKKNAQDSRIKQEVLWYEIQLFLDGDQYHIFPETKQRGSLKVQPIKRRRGEIRRTINKMRPLLRTLKATTASTDMRFEVPGGSEDGDLASKYLNYFVDNYTGVDGVNGFSDIVADVVDFGFKRSVGYFDVYWNSAKARPEVESRDPFDLYMDRHGKYALRTYTMRKEDILEARDFDGNKIFQNTESLVTTSKRSSSDIYNNYLDYKYDTTKPSEEALADVMLEEYHKLEEVEQEVEEGKASAGETYCQVRIVTIPEDGDAIFNEEVDKDDEIRFISFFPERRPNDIYNEPWMKDALDPQKSMNNVYTHIEEYMRTVGKGRILKRKDQALDRISDADGQIIEYDGNQAPEFFTGLDIKGGDFGFWNQMTAVMEDVVGIHPSQIQNQRVAKAIGYLLAQDEQNTSEPFRNLKNCLVKVGQRLLKLANRHMMAHEEIFWFQDGQQVSEKVIGMAGAENLQGAPDGIKTLSNPKKLTVDIIPRGAFASLAREEKIKELVGSGIITSPEVAMEGMNIGNVKELAEKEMMYRGQQAQQQQQSQLIAQQNKNPKPVNNEDSIRNVVEDLRSEVF